MNRIKTKIRWLQYFLCVDLLPVTRVTEGKLIHRLCLRRHFSHIFTECYEQKTQPSSGHKPSYMYCAGLRQNHDDVAAAQNSEAQHEEKSSPTYPDPTGC